MVRLVFCLAEYNICDHLGSVRFSVNTDDGSVVNSKTYSDFGKASAEGGDRLGYIGKENDVESGLGDFEVRKYDDASGRFLSIDPLPQSWVGEVFGVESVSLLRE